MILRALLLSVLPVAAAAQDAREVFEAMALPEVIGVMSEEGVAYGATLAETLYPDAPVPADWTETVEGIYDPERMRADVLASLEASLEGEDTAAMVAFLGSEAGRDLVALELAAHEALLDEAVEEAAREAAAVAVADEDPRLELLRRYAEVNDIVDTNVVGAMNSNFAYFMGLMDGGAMDGAVTEGEVLADVWAQEARIRADTTEWVYSFLLMAYGSAPPEDVEALIAFSESEPGQALNRAVFDAFGGVFADIQRSLGRASARVMATTEL